MDVAAKYREFDVTLESLLDRARGDGFAIPCKRGCDACCYDVAVVSHVELRPLIEAVRAFDKETQRKVRARLDTWIARAVRAGIDPLDPAPDVPTWFRARLKCPLLDTETHDCMVYDARPVACRGHHVVDAGPEVCANRANEPGIPFIAETIPLVSDFLAAVVADSPRKGREVHVVMGLLQTMLLAAWPLIDDPNLPIDEWLTGELFRGSDRLPL